FVADAPVCILAFARQTPRHTEDTCAAVENMLIAAHAHGLGSCWIAGENAPYEREIARICKAPDGFRLVALFSLGYANEKPGPH
ncbi:MAG TPA: nitroreductase family protein, partial [Firmicutes bacterium]|nr:nitroreductase family protein [Bacillota bacterium]